MIVLRLIPAHAGKTRDCLRRHSRGPAHPRSRGENTAGGLDRPEADGSSPLTRGKHRLPCRSSFGRRLIPAHAGKTSPPRTRPASPWAHPRSRGENIQALDSSERAWGSSPLTRGKRVCQLVTPARRGLIPAHAGKTRCLSRSTKCLRAHPRSRGENNRNSRQFLPVYGSSPLTRGKPNDHRDQRREGGLIPAHAGKTVERVGGYQVLEAHPRSRGENTVTRRCHSTRHGSSPLTRGKRRSVTQTATEARLIPAHAGKTWRPPKTRRVGWAHPRSRGENNARGDKIAGAFGSSPLTRGKRSQVENHHGTNRLIPAHAGKTPLSWHRRRCSPAHPRSRGENALDRCEGIVHRGSSPLTRGKLSRPGE